MCSKNDVSKHHMTSTYKRITEYAAKEVVHAVFFWLPAACGGAALEANITVVVVLVLMSFTRKLLFCQ